MRNESRKEVCVLMVCKKTGSERDPHDSQKLYLNKTDFLGFTELTICSWKQEFGSYLFKLVTANYINRLEFGSKITTGIFLPKELSAPVLGRRGWQRRDGSHFKPIQCRSWLGSIQKSLWFLDAGEGT